MSDFNMNLKWLIVGFIGVIVALVIIATASDSVFLQRNTLESINTTVTAPAVNGTLDLTGRTLVGTGIVTNFTDGLANETLTISSQLGSDGLQTVQLTVNDFGAGYAGELVNVSYTYEPSGYLPDGGSRNVAFLIILMAALAIVVWVIVVFMKGGMGNLMKLK